MSVWFWSLSPVAESKTATMFSFVSICVFVTVILHFLSQWADCSETCRKKFYDRHSTGLMESQSWTCWETKGKLWQTETNSYVFCALNMIEMTKFMAGCFTIKSQYIHLLNRNNFIFFFWLQYHCQLSDWKLKTSAIFIGQINSN